ncbi:ankyrin repeat-containing protein BDA1-like [Durio zibethinus]|uniref:Ankyrin repeat-containing protein BDA1-like n=1 Tax=Durio zibethinus TaxID=66656 RepID=A0A6P5XW37_DURZI|nr:ankyrin repeat-containing protein BDA1-like [Durio zibethinus]
MERKLYDAAVQGSVISLRNLLQEDALLLDRFITGHYSETPLHVASMLGHLEFVDEVLARKPELAKELDSRQSSPLHLATAKGYLDIVKRLLQVNPDMCLVCNFDGRNPLHIAAIMGKLDVLRELVHARPWAARLPMDEGETILHACVRYNQLEAMKFLVERVSDHDFVNCRNSDGNTFLHLAVAAKQIEAINFLISSTTVDVNCENADGFTALDLLSQNQRDVIDKEIVESLGRMGALRAKKKPLSNRQLKSARTKILTSRSTSNTVSKPMKSKDHKRVVNRNTDWLERKRNSLMVVASLLATMAFQAGVNPPSGVWQDDSKQHYAGYSIWADSYPISYEIFLISNTTGFLASLSIILLLISGLPLRHRFFMWVLMVIMWVAISAMAYTYLVSVSAISRTEDDPVQLKVISSAVYVWLGLMLLLLLGHTIRLIIRLIKYLRKLVISLINVISTRGPGA